MTIKDIAALANVSVSTVSKVLNNKDSDIGEETRKRVLKIVKEYQYTPYSKVKESLSGRSYILGLIMPRNLRSNRDFLTNIEKAVTKNGYSLQVYFTESAAEEEKYIKILAGKSADGILFYAIESAAKAIGILNKEKIPFILLKKEEQAASAGQVYFDLKKTGYLAAKYLIESGHRNIGFLMGDNKHERQVKEGYSKALFEEGIPYQADRVFVGQDEREAGNIGIHQFFDRDITAVICSREKIACVAYQTCERHGIRIPEDLSIIGLKGDGLGEILIPKLDLLAVPYELAGDSAVSALIDIIESKAVPHTLSREIEAVILPGESVAKPAHNKLRKTTKIIVVGSMNMDIAINVDKLPTDGEVVITHNLIRVPGGKGANQAVGVGRLGGLVYAIGCLGNDNDGKKIYKSLAENSVKTEGVVFDDVAATGKAYVNIAENGESGIVIYPGANNHLDTHQLGKFRKLFEGAQICLLSLEITQKAAMYAIDLCSENHVKVIVKPSTIGFLPEEYLKKIEFLVPNERELNQLVAGDYKESPPHLRSAEEVKQKAEVLFHKGVKNVIVTLGNKGCYLKNKDYELFFDAAPFEAFDAMGAADAFISALAVRVGEGHDIISAIVFATYSGGISITRQGSQASMPDRMIMDMYQDEIISSIKEIRSNLI